MNESDTHTQGYLSSLILAIVSEEKKTFKFEYKEQRDKDAKIIVGNEIHFWQTKNRW
jgi:hypothetical protein